jgi:hypothetical protein
MEPRIKTRAVGQPKEKSHPDASVWRPSPLTLWFLAIVAFDAVMLILAMGIITTGNDPAGNGMVDGVRQGFAQLSAGVLALLTLIFLVIRHRGIRFALMALLVPLTSFCLLLTR